VSVFVALLVGKSVQVSQLQGLLKSRFAQMAVVSEAQGLLAGAFTAESLDTGKVVKMVAKTFYREMTKAGFRREHIVSAATEIISLLSESLDKHDRRIQREKEVELCS